MKNLFKANSESKTGKTIFYIFEISALVVGVLMLIFGIYEASLYHGADGFMIFLRDLANIAFDVLVIYGIGKIIDFLYCKHEAKSKDTKNDEKSE